MCRSACLSLGMWRLCLFQPGPDGKEHCNEACCSPDKIGHGFCQKYAVGAKSDCREENGKGDHDNNFSEQGEKDSLL